MQFLEENIRTREQNYLRVEKVFRDNPDFVDLRHDHISLLSTFAFPMVLKTPELRQHYLQKLSAAGVEIRPMIAGNMQHQPFYKKYVKQLFDLPGADMMHTNGLYCGNYPELTDADLTIIEQCVSR